MSVIIPAIDLRGGRCVRLVQGRKDAETVYSDDPVAVARRFARAGAHRLHVVDLDGAFDGLPRNLDVVSAIVEAVDIPVQLGGGIRHMAAIDEVLRRGVHWVILGTAAVEIRNWWTRRAGDIPAAYWSASTWWTAGGGTRLGDGTGRDAVELARRHGPAGRGEIIFTDIARDGMLQGPNIEALRRWSTQALQHHRIRWRQPNSTDIEALSRIDGVTGIIIGKAIYTGAVDLEERAGPIPGKQKTGGGSREPGRNHERSGHEEPVSRSRRAAVGRDDPAQKTV